MTIPTKHSYVIFDANLVDDMDVSALSLDLENCNEEARIIGDDHRWSFSSSQDNSDHNHVAAERSLPNRPRRRSSLEEDKIESLQSDSLAKIFNHNTNDKTTCYHDSVASAPPSLPRRQSSRRRCRQSNNKQPDEEEDGSDADTVVTNNCSQRDQGDHGDRPPAMMSRSSTQDSLPTLPKRTRSSSNNRRLAAAAGCEIKVACRAA